MTGDAMLRKMLENEQNNNKLAHYKIERLEAKITELQGQTLPALQSVVPILRPFTRIAALVAHLPPRQVLLQRLGREGEIAVIEVRHLDALAEWMRQYGERLT